MSDVSSESAVAVVDWAAITTTVECPLCLYNLRGLAEPRCPECGYRFQWAELLDPQRHKHQYLFEHHPKRNIWSFIRTILGGLRTRKFWASVKPTQMVRMRRLMIYWIVCSCFLVLIPVSRLIPMGIYLAQYNATARQRFLKRTPNLYTIPGAKQYVDANYPLAPSVAFFRQIPKKISFELAVWWGIEVGSVLIWPWLTFAALMVFRASMRKAKVKRGHVLRCVLYSSDAAVLYAVVTLMAITGSFVWLTVTNEPLLAASFNIWLIVLLWLLRLDRLSVAYRKYLQFDHAFFAVLASQVIVLLVFACMLFWGGEVVRQAAWGL